MNSIQIISKYRTHIMGIAILWVMLFHANNDFGYNIINRLSSIGYGGVDIFLFISGFGLYYASRKEYSTTEFYKKRLVRIFPSYLLILLLIDIFIGTFSLSSYLIKLTTIGFWLPFTHLPYFTWYIPAIIAFYLIFPFYIKLFNKKPIVSTIIAILFGLGVSALYSYVFTVCYPEEKNHLMLFTSRIPIFFIGVYFGMLSLNEQKFFRHKYIICITMFIIGLTILFFSIQKLDYWTLRNQGLYYYPFILITPGLCLILGKCLSFLPSFINKIFFFIGSISLEIYLIHETLFNYNRNIIDYLHCSTSIGFIILIVISIFIGYIISYSVKWLEQMLAKYSRYKDNYNKKLE